MNNETYSSHLSSDQFSINFSFTGVPSVDMSYDFTVFYPVYHTVHDTYKWLQGLIDPNFQYHLTTTQVASRLLMNAADTYVLPFNVSKYAVALKNSLDILKTNYGAELEQNNTTLSFIENAIQNFKRTAQMFEKEKENAMDNKSDIALRDLNNRMVNVEKAFIYPLGLPNQPTTRHVVFAPSTNNKYGTTSFPGISDLLYPANKSEEDWESIKKQISIVFKAISEATDALLPNTK